MRRPSEGSGRGARGAGAARGDPLRRRLQHAAAADAVGHRPGRGAGGARHSACGSTCPASAATCRTATRSRSRTACSCRGRRSRARASSATIRCGADGSKDRGGMYAPTAPRSAWSALARRGERPDQEPDLFCMALLARFEGYFSGFSHWIRDHPDQLTWAVLKAHTQQSRRHRATAFGRSARHAAGELPLLRRGRRCRAST